MPGIDLDSLSFAEPDYLALLAFPGLMVAMMVWRAVVRRIEVSRVTRERSVPLRQRFAFMGSAAFWLCLVLASACCILAVARPVASATLTKRAGVDIIVLQDASASMLVRDVQPDRWQISQRFIRTLAETVSWRGDRMALALFAHNAAPQVRLTNDPNALFFFLDHLSARPPLSLENETTWNTNIEQALEWGLKLIGADTALSGRSPNVQAFVIVSDGQAWSGEVERTVEAARQQQIPIYVVGVGTTTGALIPRPPHVPGAEPAPRIRSSLDRQSLRRIARLGLGDYFELGRDMDRDIALRIVTSLRSHAPETLEQGVSSELYWYFLLAAAIAAGTGALFLYRRTELLWHLGGLAVGLFLLLHV